MRITSIQQHPFHAFPHQMAAGQGRTATHPINLYRGVVDSLPPDLDALLVASDLQGIAPLQANGGASALVGEVLAEQLAMLAAKKEVPPLSKIGVVLAGDLYSSPRANQRGASGDVRSVWRAFANTHRWVTGVAGNHDSFADEPPKNLLDGNCIDFEGLRIGGVGGIIGDPAKPARREEKEFLRAMRKVLSEKPQVLVLHCGPDASRGELRGHEAVRQALDRSGELLVLCGHVYWPDPLADLRGGAQVLNADGRVVLLMRG